MARRKSVQLKGGGCGGGPPCPPKLGGQGQSTFVPPTPPELRLSPGELRLSLFIRQKSFVCPFLIKLSQTLSCNGRGGSLFFFRPTGARDRVCHPPACPPTPQQRAKRSYHAMFSAARPDLRVTLWCPSHTLNLHFRMSYSSLHRILTESSRRRIAPYSRL